MMQDPRPDIVRFVRRLCAFFGVFLVSYVTVLTAAVTVQRGGIRGLRYTNVPLEAPTFGGQTALMFDELDTVTTIDVLWVGSSHAYRTFDPRFFDRHGVKTFNLGTTAQTPLNTYFLVKEHLDDLDPRLVVFEVYWNVLTWDGVESTLDLLANHRPTPWLARMAVATLDIRSMNAVARRIVDWRRPSIDDVPVNLFEADTYINRGFVEKNDTFTGNRDWDDGSLQVERRQLSFLSKTVRYIRDRGIPVVLMTQPLPEKTLTAMANWSDVRDRVDAIATRNDVPYVDFNGMVSLNDETDFFDSHHLSRRGLNVFLPAVLDYLIQRGLVTER